ncbi:MAG: ATP-dependent DNA helicase UvrD2 [Actinobacteria bacterium]|nr:ATP-dependent DNA helicase UvrD2 [Actinomycetota bacterium]
MDLNAAQQRAVESESQPLCILAGAGSGKTRVLTRRIAHRLATGTATPGHVVAVTFTRKAGDELRTRLRSLGVRDGVAAGTFHSLAYAQLRQRWADVGERPPALLDRKVRIIGPLLRGRSRQSAGVQPADIAGEIEWAKARMINPERYAAAAQQAARTPPLPLAEVGAIYRRYEDEKKRKGLVDFDDLLWRCVKAIEDDTAFAAAQRWRFRHLFVDEFQDVNPVQFRLLSGWMSDDGRPDLCVVGDPNQAIYSWNGADPSYLTEFTRRFPGADVVELTANYRSTPQILAVANAVLERGRLEPTLDAGPVPIVRSFDSDQEEARGVARALRRAHGAGTRWREMAVLTRTNAQGVLFEEAFGAAGVPFRVRSGGAFLQQAEVKDALGTLRKASSFAAWSRDLEADVADLTDTDERRLHLEALLRLAAEFAALDPAPTAAAFNAWLVATISGETPGEATDSVEITTFHRAKGLEWPIVFVAGLERGLVPIGRAESPDAQAEERRLLYVAVTRAQRELHCTWAARRTFGTKAVPRQPSAWLDLIEDARARLEGRPALTRTGQRSGLASARTKLPKGRGNSSKGEPDPPVLAALKVWRTSAAKAANVPAYVIFHDTTLAAVAEARPRTEAELLSLPGLGPVKAARYGEDLLAVVAEHGAA